MTFFADSSSSSKQYRVRAFMPNEPDTCDCMAFVMARNKAGGKNSGAVGHCKHIDKVRREVCPWIEGHREPQKIPGVCPLCGGPTTEKSEPALPEREQHAVDEVTEKLRAMAAELQERQEQTQLTDTVDDLMQHITRR